MLKAATPQWGPDSCSRQLEHGGWYEGQLGEKENKEDAVSVPSTVKSLGESWIPQPFEWIDNGDGTYKKQLKGKYNVQYYDKAGCALPMYIEDLAWNLHQDKVTSKDDIHKFYAAKVWDEQYFQTLLAQVYHHPLFDEFEKYTISFYELSDGEWWFGDENGDQLEDMVDFTHYMLADFRVRDNTAAWDNVDPGFAPDPPAADRDKILEPIAKPVDKNEANSQELTKLDGEDKDEMKDDDANPVAPTAPTHRLRSKQPGVPTENTDKENKANWGVTWAPLTRKGFVDFIGYCSGHAPHVLENDQQQLLQCSIATTSNNPHVQNLARPIKWQPIKPGETSYLLNQFFHAQVEKPEPVTELKDMNLTELIAFAKTIDFDSQADVPKDTPMYVRATLCAIGSMWVSFGTDAASEVRHWLSKQCLDISSLSLVLPSVIKTQYNVYVLTCFHFDFDRSCCSYIALEVALGTS